MPAATTTPGVEDDAPLSTFSRCHVGILSQLEATAKLPELAEAAERARRTAQSTIELFDHAVLKHHEEEEDELFTAVMKSATSEERAHVGTLVQRLTAEHRRVESLWKSLEPAVKAVARGAPAQLDAAALAELVRCYDEHARFEEGEFLPLAERILGRNDNHMAALGMSLHMRHLHPRVIGYI